MNTTDLHTYLNQFHPLPEADYGQLAATLKTKYAAKGLSLVTPGQVQRELYFVRSGVQMSFFEADPHPQVIALYLRAGDMRHSRVVQCAGTFPVCTHLFVRQPVGLPDVRGTTGPVRPVAAR
jgi:hypothetical protein